jgi:hypothetical protein
VKTKALILSSAAAALFACGGKTTPPATPDTPAAPSAPTPPATAAPPAATDTPPTAATSTPKDPTAAGTDAKYDDPEEAAHGGTVTMTPLITKADKGKTKFPKKTVGDKECWQGTALAGDAKKDFDVIIQKCVGPTGLLEYAKPVSGKLHHVHDKRDTYKLKLLGGMCYRYFAVADNGINDLDILVTKPGGALVADDKTQQPVAIIEFDKAWCMDDDADYEFHIEVDGPGTGRYIFGVFTKPK